MIVLGLDRSQKERFEKLSERMLAASAKRAKAHIADTAHDLDRWPDLAEDILGDFENTVKFYEEKVIGEVRQSNSIK
jgi:hypothetical protein